MKLSNNQQSLIIQSVDIEHERKIVLVDVSEIDGISKIEHNSNIYCVNKHWDVIWQVAVAEQPLAEKDCFVFIEIEGNLLKASRFFGSEFDVEIDSGLAIESGWHK
jgi:hypothetical protein